MLSACLIIKMASDARLNSRSPVFCSISSLLADVIPVNPAFFLGAVLSFKENVLRQVYSLYIHKSIYKLLGSFIVQICKVIEL